MTDNKLQTRLHAVKRKNIEKSMVRFKLKRYVKMKKCWPMFLGVDRRHRKDLDLSDGAGFRGCQLQALLTGQFISLPVSYTPS